jgi:hypothetical protein
MSVAVEIERQAYSKTFTIPGIGECFALEPYAWTEADFIKAIRTHE